MVEQIGDELRVSYPNLHLILDDDQGAVVQGTFPVVGAAGETLDRYTLSIEIPDTFPEELPVVRETAGRIPWTTKDHVESDGKACVLLPEDRQNCFPPGSTFKDFLDGPVHNFFLGQSLVALGQPWPFGEWRHGADGVIEFYSQYFGINDRSTVINFLTVLAKRETKPHWICPCGSGRKIKACCRARLARLRHQFPRASARASLNRLRSSK